MFFRSVTRNNLIRQTFRKSVCTVCSVSLRPISISCSNPKFYNKREVSSFLQDRREKWKFQCIRNYSDYPPHQKIPLPALSPTMETGKIISWEKKEGDKLNEGDLLAEIETDKATIGFETPEEGYLAKILIPAGTKNIPIGQPVCIIVENEADVAKFKDFKDDSAPAAAAPAAPAPAAPTPAAPTPAAATPAPAAPAPSEPSGGRVLVSPMAKGLAEKRNIRLQGKGSGLFGSITSKDLDKLAAASAGAPAPTARPGAAAPAARPTPSPGAAYVDIPVSNMRAVIAKRLVESKNQIPHFYITARINMDKLVKLRTKLNKKYEKQGARVSVNDFIIKATAAACKRVPQVNASWMGDFIRQYKNVDVSVAVAVPQGLVTPIVFEANDKGVLQISKEMKDLAARAKENKLLPQEFQGGTVCVSNLGMMDIEHFSAVVNPPHSLIVAIAAIQDTIVPDDSEKGFKVAKIMRATLSGDHRSIDGIVGAEWMMAFKDCLEDPEMMIV